MNASADTVTEPTAIPHTDYRREKPRKLPIYLNTSRLTSHLFFGPYIWIPIVTTLAWLSGLLALVSIWARDGKPQYAPKQADVVFISNVAGKHKNVFIPMTCITAGGYVLSLLAERWLRHQDRLPTDQRRREKVFRELKQGDELMTDWLAIFFAAAGGSGLIALAIMDNYNHGRIHWSMTCVFVVCTALSAIFQSGEVWSLHKDHPDRRSLLRNSIYKLIIVVLAVAGAISFAVLYGVCRGSRVARGNKTAAQCNRITSGAAAMEWAIAFILVFFYATIIADLWPAGKSSPRYMAALARWQERNEPGALKNDFTGRRAFNDEAALERWHTAEAEGRVPSREAP